MFCVCNFRLIQGLRINDKILQKTAYFLFDICDDADSNSSISFVVCKVSIEDRNTTLLPHSYIPLEAGRSEADVVPSVKIHSNLLICHNGGTDYDH